MADKRVVLFDGSGTGCYFNFNSLRKAGGAHGFVAGRGAAAGEGSDQSRGDTDANQRERSAERRGEIDSLSRKRSFGGAGGDRPGHPQRPMAVRGVVDRGTGAAFRA